MIVAISGGSTDVEVWKEVPSDTWADLPADYVLEPGAAYQLTARDDLAGPPLATASVETLSREEEVLYRRRLDFLKRVVPDVSHRRYAHLVLAMSGGLHDAATEILLQEWPDPAAVPGARGLWMRAAFLFHRIGEESRRDAVIRALREDS